MCAAAAPHGGIFTLTAPGQTFVAKIHGLPVSGYVVINTIFAAVYFFLGPRN